MASGHRWKSRPRCPDVTNKLVTKAMGIMKHWWTSVFFLNIMLSCMPFKWTERIIISVGHKLRYHKRMCGHYSLLPFFKSQWYLRVFNQLSIQLNI